MPSTLARCQNRKFRRWASHFLLLAVLGGALALPLAAKPVSASAATSASPTQASAGPGLEAAPDTITATGSNACAVAAYKAGFSYTDYLDTAEGEIRSVVVAVAVCLAESSGNPNVYLCNPSLVTGNAPISCPSGTTSVDRGLWQINSVYWSQVSNACAFNGQCNGNAAWGLISDQGTDWSAWRTYTTGAWENYLSIAQGAISGFTVQLRNPNSNECLAVDADDIGNEGLIWQFGCGSNGWEDWEVDVVSSTAPPELENPASGECLAIDADDIGNEGTIWQWGCGGNGWLEWQVNGSGDLNTNGDADLELENLNAGKCLAVDANDIGNEGLIWQWGCGANGWLEWS
jgi:hypothetical protein